MNCSPVKVIGTSSSFTGPRHLRANIFGQGTCNTVEGVDVVYPNPGKSVFFGGAFKGGNTGPATTLANCNFDQNVNLSTNGGTVSAGSASTSNSTSTSSSADSSASPSTASSASSSSDPSESSSSAAAVSPAGTASANVPVKVIATTTTVGAAATVQTPAAAADPSSSNDTTGTTSTGTTTGGSCTDNGAIHCGPDGTTFYMCSNDELIYMGPVAAGTLCSNGQITRKRSLPPQLHRRKHAWVF